MLGTEELELKNVLCLLALLATVTWWAARRFSLFGGKSVDTQPGMDSIHEGDYPDLQIPSEPHFECILDPHPPGGMHFSNPEEAYDFENAYVKGKWLVLIPSAADDAAGKWTAGYFKGKKRLWEVRLQMKFKQPPPPGTDVYFGVELGQYVAIPTAVNYAQSVAVSAAKAVLGSVYHSNGDDPKTTAGEIERPSMLCPLWTFDQFIVTPQGEEIPKLNDRNFRDLGESRSKRVKQYVKSLNEVMANFDTTTTYTFVTWGVSRFLDVLSWQVQDLPFISPMDFNKFCGKPPVGVVLYSMDPSDNAGDTRHLQSRKKYLWHCTIWSSNKRPEKRRFEQLTGIADPLLVGNSAGMAKKGLWRRTKGLFTESLACCTSRPHA